MSLCQDRRFVSLLCSSVLAMLVVLFAITTAPAQEETPPKWDVFVGYQWLNPGGNFPIAGTSPVQTTPAPTAPRGAGSAIAYNFNRFLALEGDAGVDFGSGGLNVATLSTGPRLMWRSPETNLFIHTLLGWNRLNSGITGPSDRIGAILGAGIDLPINRAITIRLLEADYQWAQYKFSESPVAPSQFHPQFNGARLRSGIIFNIGGAPVIPPSASCSVQPSSVMVGEPITATATGSNFDPKHTLTYSWSATGGKVTGKDNTANIDTNGVAGGSYTVSAHIVDPKVKKGGEASCSASFTVKEPPKNPPTMSCSASPSSVQAGTAATITCTCTSPDSVPVNVAGWTSSGGSISGSGSTATLDTTGASAGPITVSATCTDSRGLTASSSSTVTVEAPPPPPPQASKLSECQFPNEKKPWRVDNTCKAVLDDVAQRLQHDPDAKLVIVGNAEPSEKRKNLAGERAVNSKAYLSGGEAKQGIDPSRIEVRTGSAGTKTAEYWVVPAGATFSSTGTQAVDESMVKAVPDHPAAPKKKAAKKAQ